MIHFAVLWFLVQVAGRIPARVLFALAYACGTLAWRLSPRLQRVTRDHMGHVLGARATPREVDAAARACVRSAAYYYADFARYSHLSTEATLAYLDALEGIDLVRAAIERGRGVIVVSGHLGAPEMVGQALAPMGLNLAAITEPLEPPAVHRLVDGVRQTHGITFFTADLAGLRAARAHLANGGVLAVLADRDVLGTGSPYVFFGEPAIMPTGVVELARRTGAEVLGARVLRGARPWRYHAYVEPIPLPAPTGDRQADLDSGMRAALAWLEGAIASAPGQWFALQPIWSGLAGDRRPGTRAALPGDEHAG